MRSYLKTTPWVGGMYPNCFFRRLEIEGGWMKLGEIGVASRLSLTKVCEKGQLVTDLNLIIAINESKFVLDRFSR